MMNLQKIYLNLKYNVHLSVRLKIKSNTQKRHCSQFKKPVLVTIFVAKSLCLYNCTQLRVRFAIKNLQILFLQVIRNYRVLTSAEIPGILGEKTMH